MKIINKLVLAVLTLMFCVSCVNEDLNNVADDTVHDTTDQIEFFSEQTSRSVKESVEALGFKWAVNE